MTGRLIACAVWFCWALLGAPRAGAQPTVLWDAAPECPPSSDSQAEVVRLLRRPLAEIAVDLSAAVRIARHVRSTRPGFEATITVVTGQLSRQRVLVNADCAVLAHAVAVVVALAIDPTAKLSVQDSSPLPSDEMSVSAPSDPPSPAAVEQTDPAQAPESIETAPVVAPPKPAPPPLPAELAAERESEHESRDRPLPLDWHVYIGAAAALGTGRLPGLAPAAVVSGGVVAAQWRAALRLSYAFPQRARLADLPSVGGHIQLWAAALEAGFRLRRSRFEVPLLAGLESGVLSARGDAGTSMRSTERELWLAGYFASGVMYVWSSALATGVRASGFIGLRRPRFALQGEVGGPRVLHRPEPFGAAGSFELELHFP